MRNALTPFLEANRLNYLCILSSELIGSDNLRDLPALLSGFESILNTLHPDVAQAIKTLRLCGFAPTTHRELRLVADAYLNHHRNREAVGPKDRDGFDQFYTIDKDFTLQRRWTTVTPPPIIEAIVFLTANPGVRQKTRPELHDPSLVASVQRNSDEYRGDIERLGFTPTAPSSYDLRRIGQAPLSVTWADLIDMANSFDAMDVSTARQSPAERSWYHRLHDKDGVPTADLLQANPSGLKPASVIDLQGVKHLIGLPGAGKTTLLYLLAACIAKRGLRACFIFPSIEVSTGFIEVLERYGVGVGLLSGQGETSRSRHILNFSTTIAKENNGYGVTKASSRFFATNCALAGFASEEEMEFPHGRPPCNDLKQRLSTTSKPQSKRCALSGSCARQQAERELIDANIWAGHVLSLDRSVSSLFADFDLKHFEFVARTFDLLVIDECDGAQADLDSRGTPIMKLFGDESALWATLIQDLHGPIARGRNAFVSGKDMPSLIEMTGRFGQATNRLSGIIQHLSPKIQAAYQNRLLTSLSIIADMFPYGGAAGDDEEIEAHFHARRGVEHLWDVAVKPVAFRPSIRDDAEEITDLGRELPEIATLLGIPPDDVTAIYTELTRAIASWDVNNDVIDIEQVGTILRGIPTITTTLGSADFIEMCGLLLSASMTVLQHFGLSPHLRLLNSLDLVSDNVFESKPSKDQLAILPESLTGKLSGIRFTVSEEGNTNITHIGVQGTPRRLFQRMHEISVSAGGNTAVLLTSATSLLEPSPRFHINVGPHYVLRRPNAGDGWKNSRYEFLPIVDQQQAGKHLRFSGAPFAQRERMLKSMADGLLEGGALSPLSAALQTNDIVNGVGRKAGFVVNSYDQCELLYQHVQSTHTHMRGKVRYLRRAGSDGHSGHAVTAAEVESLGFDEGWDTLIFR